ncbi:MAG: SLBB domain-containing protein [Pyrinomonadaceae bacterium]
MSKVVRKTRYLRTEEQTSEATSNSAVDPDKLLHIDDLIDIDVIGSVEFDWRGRVSPEGYIEGLPFPSAPIVALCRNTNSIERQVETQLSKFLRDPDVKVRELDGSKRAEVLVTGAVMQPSRFRLLRKIKLDELLIKAGGLTDETNGKILIFRQSMASCNAWINKLSQNDPLGIGFTQNSLIDVSTFLPEKLSKIEINISDLLKGAPSANPEIFYGDTISAEKAQPVYVTGAVRTPTRIMFREGLTARRAINSAGGELGGAVQAFVFRNENGSMEKLPVDLSRQNTAEQSSVLLKPFDIIEVLGKNVGEVQAPPAVEVPKQQGTEALPLRIIE